MRNLNGRRIITAASVTASCAVAALLACLVLARAAGVAGAAESKAGAAADHDAIQGTWKMVSGHRNGQEVPAPEGDRAVRLRFAGDKAYDVRNGTQRDPVGFTLGPDKSPKQIDLVPESGSGKGQTIRGIYELEGDRLKLCMVDKGDRPADFVPGKDRAVMVFERDK